MVRAPSDGAQIVSRGLPGPAIGDNLKREPLSLIEAAHPGAFDSADVHEHVLAAVIRLDETEAFLAVEPLYDSLRHVTFFQVCVNHRALTRYFRFEFWINSSVLRTTRDEAKSFGRSSIGGA
jgi:hypothetical protein